MVVAVEAVVDDCVVIDGWVAGVTAVLFVDIVVDGCCVDEATVVLFAGVVDAAVAGVDVVGVVEDGFAVVCDVGEVVLVDATVVVGEDDGFDCEAGTTTVLYPLLESAVVLLAVVEDGLLLLLVLAATVPEALVAFELVAVADGVEVVLVVFFATAAVVGLPEVGADLVAVDAVVVEVCVAADEVLGVDGFAAVVVDGAAGVVE